MDTIAAREAVAKLVCTPQEALTELEHRRKSISLLRAVERHLNGDIPEYLQQPALCLARHVVTPNFETLRFIHQMGRLGFKTTISQDSSGQFVSQNFVKRALCKLPMCRRITQKGTAINEHYEYTTIIDFNSSDGKRFKDIRTLWGEPLIDFHRALLTEWGMRDLNVPDDADWIDRHHRGDLLAHYKSLLTLFVAHGIFFENYNLDDKHEVHFVNHILRPACEFVEFTFGVRPIIAEIFPDKAQSYLFWISYPLKAKETIRRRLAGR